jgi:hypothetical protein
MGAVFGLSMPSWAMPNGHLDDPCIPRDFYQCGKKSMHPFKDLNIFYTPALEDSK